MNKNIKKNLKELVPYITIIIVVVLIRTFIATPVKVDGTSMNPTLNHGDTMILNKIGLRFNNIKRFDIVVIKTSKSYLIKRVIGLPGETINYEDGKLYINGKRVEDPYYNNNTDDFESVKIAKDHYYVMGDNRSDSIDSRIIGQIKEEDIIGTTSFVLFPLSDIGKVK